MQDCCRLKSMLYAGAFPLRKAYAAVLLKWRGHKLPTLAALSAQL